MGYKYNGIDYEISHITAFYSEDRENVLGICRMISVDIDTDFPITEDIKSKIEGEISNHFAEDEYHTEDKNWRTDAINDIRKYTGVSSIDIE